MCIGYRKSKLTNDVNLTYHGFEICNQLSSYLSSFCFIGLHVVFWIPKLVQSLIIVSIQNAETCVCGLKHVTCCDRLSLFPSVYICTTWWAAERLQYIDIRIVVTFKYAECEPHVWTAIHSTTMRGKVLPAKWGRGKKLTKVKGYWMWDWSP